MPRFYFNVYNHVSARDEEGIELSGLDAAQAEARAAAAELIAEQIIDGEPIDLRHRIEVEDAERNVVFVLTFRNLVRLE